MENGRKTHFETLIYSLKRSVAWAFAAVKNEPLGTLAVFCAGAALFIQFGDASSRRADVANSHAATAAAYKAWFDTEGDWNLWVSAMSADGVMAPIELAVTPVIAFPESERTQELGKPYSVVVDELETPGPGEKYRVVVENIRKRVCSPQSGNRDLCDSGEIQRFLVSVTYGDNATVEKRAFQERG